MDRSVQNVTPKSLLSPRIVSRASIPSSSRRNSILPGVKKSSTRFSVSGRSNQSVQVVCKTPFHVVESFGVPLPVLVTEALTFADRSAAVSVEISAEGWAWFVCGRRLLIWQYKQPLEAAKQRRPINSQCRELTLPPSDLAHKANLVSVYIAEGNQVPSCIAVSPEGVVRYWPSIAHEGTSVEDSAQLQGQECDSLTNIAPLGCVLATTTATIVLVLPHVAGGRHTVSCRTLKTPSGWLGGIGRRMSSLIFGGLPTSQQLETRLVKVIAVESSSFGVGEWQVYVLAEHCLQKWVLTQGEPERLVYELDVNRVVREAYQETIWDACAGSPGEMDLWLMDMQATDGGVIILAAAANTHITPHVHYALGKLSTAGTVPPTKFSTFCPINYNTFYHEGDDEIQSYKLLLVGQCAFLYNQKMVIAVSASTFGEEPDIIEFTGLGDRLLGGAISGNVPVLCFKLHGLVSVSPADFSPNDFLNSSVSLSDAGAMSDVTMTQFSEAGVNITMSEMELDDLALNKDSTARMKAAFIYYIKNQRSLSQSDSILQELFPPEDEPVIDIDAALDSVVVNVSCELVNDAPAGDPRWSDVRSSSVGLGSSASLQILNQLQDKQRALDLYIAFLKDSRLWDRLCAVTSRGVVMVTSYVLGEHAEKLVAAIALRTIEPNHSTVIDDAIRQVVTEQGLKPSGSLSYQDLFYKEVTKVHKLIQALARWCDELTHSDRRPQEVAALVSEASAVVLAVLQEVVQYRQQKAEVFSPNRTLSAGMTEYLPWTASGGSGGLRESLVLLHKVTLRHGARATGDPGLRSRLYDQLVNLTDVMLDARKCHVESLRGSERFEVLLQQYESERSNLIQPFLEDEEYERAAILAEKYCHFQALVQICELTRNSDRLNDYMERFADQDFSQFVFGWYVREKKQGRLLEQFRRSNRPRVQQQALAQFLGDHPTLSWVQNVFGGDFEAASQTLQALARDETELLPRKKTMLSLAKLTLLASGQDSPGELETINSELDLVSHQEDLPQDVLSAFGFDTKRPRVLTPAELIKLYVCEDNQDASEYDFKKALDLLRYIDDDFEKSELRHHIWCQTILRDTWTDGASATPVSVIQDKLFFRLVDVVVLMGDDVNELLPPLDRMLEAPELGPLKESSSFQYLLRIGYEHVQQKLQDIC